MRYNKIFTTCFTYNSWVRFIHAHIFTNHFPHIVEYTSRTSEVNTSKISMRKTNFTNGRSIHINQIDDTIW